MATSDDYVRCTCGHILAHHNAHYPYACRMTSCREDAVEGCRGFMRAEGQKGRAPQEAK